jgi:hypothetical protein
VTGSRQLVLAAHGYSWGQAVWGEPVLIGADGSTTRVAKLKPASFEVGWGQFTIDKGPDGQPLRVADRTFTDGLFAHAESRVIYKLDRAYIRFEAWIGVNHTAGKQGNVTFEVYDAEKLAAEKKLALLRNGFTRDCLTSLRATLTATGGDPGLSKRLSACESDFDTLRAAIEKSELPATLADFEQLVFDIRKRRLDAPLLFVKRHPYYSPHIYDDYLPYHPGGGIYVLENPSAPLAEQRVRPVIDAKTASTLGGGVYRDPDLSFDTRRMVFGYKGGEQDETAIFEIGLDGTGLRRLSRPNTDMCKKPPPSGLIGEGHHDIAPCYLPDGRIAFLSTRTAGLVMCFNNYIATLHTMAPDGKDVRCISVNNVSEFDPTVLPDGRLLYGRWEYVDKTALYMQSLWVVNPDGSGETAVFKNNLAKPTAVLDARPVPGTALIAASLTPHNGQSVGAIATIDPRKGKNELSAIRNFTPEYPTEMDQGLKQGPCDPWPLDEDSMLIADNAPAHGPHGVLQLIDRFGFRFDIRREADISCFSPILVKSRAVPPKRESLIRDGEPALFSVHDLYQGMTGVPTGTVKWLRIVETTARVSGIPPGGRWWNQAFLVSWQGSYDVKNAIGIVPVEADGSAHFEAPPGKALYLQALDGDGRMVQSMRTFIQAVPGVTRSCTGCHIANDTAPASAPLKPSIALKRAPSKPAPEAWGHGLVDYPSMVQPVLDRHCVSCHGGEKGIAGGLDFSGGWTWAFNLSYETFIKNTLTGFLNCNNGQVKTSEIQPPWTHGSGVAPLTKLLLSGHNGHATNVSRSEIALLMAWMDENSNFHGNWDYTSNMTVNAMVPLREKLLAGMEQQGCLSCHPREIGSDWVNLQQPALSRLLRAPLASADGHGLGWCRDRKANKPARALVTQAQQPPDVFTPATYPKPDTNGTPAKVFADTGAPGYRALLALVEQGRSEALAAPRSDMPGAVAIRGEFRELAPLGAPKIETAKNFQ